MISPLTPGGSAFEVGARRRPTQLSRDRHHVELSVARMDLGAQRSPGLFAQEEL
jgi:hypothetical protein